VSERETYFFVVIDNPRLPRAMVAMDQYVAEVFPEAKLTAFKRQKNISSGKE
jgi:hypothetical protein